MGVASLNSSVWLEFCRLSQSGVKGEARRTVKSPQCEKSEIAQRERKHFASLTSHKQVPKGNWRVMIGQRGERSSGAQRENKLKLPRTLRANHWGRKLHSGPWAFDKNECRWLMATEKCQNLLMVLFVYKTTPWNFDAFRSERCSFASNTPHDISRDSVCSDTMFFHCFSFPFQTKTRRR